MHVGASWKQKKPEGKFDAIVIGSGIGGLTAAAALAKHGDKRVLVLERHYRAGGYTHTFTRPGYEWDVGVHYIGQVGEKGSLRVAFDRLTDGRLKWAALPEVYDRIIIGQKRYDFVAGREKFVERLTGYFPEEGEAIRRYVELVRDTARKSSGFFINRALPKAVGLLAGPLLNRGFPAIAARTTKEVLDELTSNAELKAVLAGQYGDYGLPPARSSFAMHAALVAHYLGGGYYPVGGASEIARGIAPGIEAKGGHIAVSAEVASIIVEHGAAVGVRMADGTELRAPWVISDAGVALTFGHLLPKEHVPAKWASALTTVSPSLSWLALYLGFKHTDRELGLTGTNLWIYPDEKHDENVARFAADPNAPFPVVYVSFPSAKDPDWENRHPGRATVDVIVPAEFGWFEKWRGTKWGKRGDDYEALKKDFTNRMLEVLFQQAPQLRDKVDHAELSTPLSTVQFATHPRGELYGIDHSPARYKLPLRPRTPVPGLFLTGADIATAGVAGGLLGGLMTAGALLGPNAAMSYVRR